LVSYRSIHSVGNFPHASPMRSRSPGLRISEATTSPTKMVLSSTSKVAITRAST
jgi:hypothetical protein